MLFGKIFEFRGDVWFCKYRNMQGILIWYWKFWWDTLTDFTFVQFWWSADWLYFPELFKSYVGLVYIPSIISLFIWKYLLHILYKEQCLLSFCFNETMVLIDKVYWIKYRPLCQWIITLIVVWFWLWWNKIK